MVETMAFVLENIIVATTKLKFVILAWSPIRRIKLYARKSIECIFLYFPAPG